MKPFFVVNQNKLLGVNIQWRWPWLIVTLLVFSALIKLSWWQYQRAEEKLVRLTRIAEYSQQESLTLPAILSLAQQGLDINDLPIALEGRFIQGQSLLLDNQTYKNRLGYRALQVLQTNFGNVLINLGWIAGSRDRSYIPEVDDFIGSIELKGHVRLVELGVMLQEQQLTQKLWPQRIQQIELDKIAELFGLPLLPFVVYLNKDEQIGFEKNWQPIVMPPEKHQGYAFQWLSLAIAWLSLMIWAAYKATKNNKNDVQEG